MRKLWVISIAAAFPSVLTAWRGSRPCGLSEASLIAPLVPAPGKGQPFSAPAPGRSGSLSSSAPARQWIHGFGPMAAAVAALAWLARPAPRRARVPSSRGGESRLSAADRSDGLGPGPHPVGTQPAPTMTPIGVVEAQLAALGRGDVETCYNFASPNKKRITGPKKNFELIVRYTPKYAPLVRLGRYEIVAALPLSDSVYLCRVRVWQPESSKLRSVAPVLDYYWHLKREPVSSIDYTSAGCWMVENVRPDHTPREIWDEEISRALRNNTEK